MALRDSSIALLLFVIPLNLAGQTGHAEAGAQAYGMANASSTLSGEWSMMQNPGGISACERVAAFFSYQNIWGLEGFGRAASGIVLPIGFGNLGAGLSRFGDALYSEQMISLAFANKVGFVRLGARLNYLQVRAEGFGSKGVLTGDFGGIVELLPRVIFGAQISNFTGAELISGIGQGIPVIMKAGISYRTSESMMVNMDLVVEDMDLVYLRTGLQFAIYESVRLRAGFETLTRGYFVGAGFRKPRFELDYAMGYNFYLGYSQQASFTILLGEL
jgi:hypothetical protein